MSDSQKLAREVEAALLAADTRFFLDLALNPYLQPIQANAIMSLMPFLSSFVLDSAEYMRRNATAGDELLQPHQWLIRSSRMRLKPLEVKNKPFEKVLYEIGGLVEINTRWYVDDYPRVVKFLRRLILPDARVPDMGVQFVGDEVFSTTHVSSINIGLTREAIEEFSLDLNNLGKYLRDMSRGIGRYTKTLAETLGVSTEATDRSSDTPPPTLSYADYLSKDFFEQLSPSISSNPAVCTLVTALLSQVNVARLLVPVAAGGNELAAFKLRLLSLYHATVTLGRLLGEDRRAPLLRPGAHDLIRAALTSPHAQGIRKSRLLRNALIHYGVEDREAAHLSPGLPLSGFIEAHTKGRTPAEVELDVELGLDHVSENLRYLMPEEITPTHDFE